MIKRLFLTLALLLGATDPTWAQFGLPTLFGYQSGACSTATLAVDSEESSNAAHHYGGTLPAASPITWSFTNTAGTELFVMVDVTLGQGFATPLTGLAVSYNSVAMVQSASFTNWNANGDSIYIFSLASPATGSHTVSISWSSGSAYDVLGAAISFVGVNGTTPLINAQTAKDTTASSTTATVSVPNTASGDFVLSALSTGSGVGAATSPTTTSAKLNASLATGDDNVALGRQSTTGGTVLAGWTVTADWWGLLAVEVQKATGSGCGSVSTATAYSLSGPTAGTVGVQTSNFTVTSNGKLTSAVTITPNDSSNGGSFSPATVSLAAGNFTSGTFTYTPANAGTYNIAATNSSTLINPNALSFTASAPTNSFFVATTGSDANPGTVTLPFKTFAKCQSAMQGSSVKTCTIRGGLYGSFPTLTLTSADNGETWQYSTTDGLVTAILDGGGTTQTGILINGGSNITINGLQMQNFVSAGVGIHGGAAVCGYASNWTATGTADSNLATNMLIHNITSDPANIFFNGGMIIQGQVTNSGMTNSVVHDVTDNGMRMGSNDDGCTPNDTISGDFFKGNTVYNVGGANNEVAAYYCQDTTSNSTGMVISGNWGRVGSGGANDQKRGVYRDEGCSGITVQNNAIIVEGAAFSGGGDSAAFMSSNHNSTDSGNLYSLGSTAQVVTLAVLQSNVNLASSGDSFKTDVIVGAWTGTQNTSQFGQTGVSVTDGCSSCGSFSTPTVTGNWWWNFSGGGLPATDDTSPHLSNPGLTGTCEAPQFGTAVTSTGVPQLPTHFGYQGYGGPPSSACPWSAT